MEYKLRERILKKLKSYISEPRYQHTLGVEEIAIQIAKEYNINLEKICLAALLHDCAKERSKNDIIEMAKVQGWPITSLEEQQTGELLHAPASAYLAQRDFGICDNEVLDAITYHTLGREKMTTLEKIIFVADMIEPNRKFPGVAKLRSIATNNLENAMLACLEHTLGYLRNNNLPIHPQTDKTYQSLLRKINNG